MGRAMPTETVPTDSGAKLASIKRCGCCGEEFEPYSRRREAQKFCSDDCRRAAWERQHPRVGELDPDAIYWWLPEACSGARYQASEGRLYRVA